MGTEHVNLDKADINLSELTNIVLAYPGKWQPSVRIIDVRAKDIDAIIETILASGVKNPEELKLSDTTEIVMLYTTAEHRMRSTKIRVVTDAPGKIVQGIMDKYEVA